MMQSMVQCPVCDLFLNVGMSLATHLETHPKEFMIKAITEMYSHQYNQKQGGSMSKFIVSALPAASISSQLQHPALQAPRQLQSIAGASAVDMPNTRVYRYNNQATGNNAIGSDTGNYQLARHHMYTQQSQKLILNQTHILPPSCRRSRIQQQQHRPLEASMINAIPSRNAIQFVTSPHNARQKLYIHSQTATTQSPTTQFVALQSTSATTSVAAATTTTIKMPASILSASATTTAQRASSVLPVIHDFLPPPPPYPISCTASIGVPPFLTESTKTTSTTTSTATNNIDDEIKPFTDYWTLNGPDNERDECSTENYDECHYTPDDEFVDAETLEKVRSPGEVYHEEVDDFVIEQSNAAIKCEEQIITHQSLYDPCEDSKRVQIISDVKLPNANESFSANSESYHRVCYEAEVIPSGSPSQMFDYQTNLDQSLKAEELDFNLKRTPVIQIVGSIKMDQPVIDLDEMMPEMIDEAKQESFPEEILHQDAPLNMHAPQKLEVEEYFNQPNSNGQFSVIKMVSSKHMCDPSTSNHSGQSTHADVQQPTITVRRQSTHVSLDVDPLSDGDKVLKLNEEPSIIVSERDRRRSPSSRQHNSSVTAHHKSNGLLIDPQSVQNQTGTSEKLYDNKTTTTLAIVAGTPTRKPYNRPPKKLVVKFIKPFLPGVENEEANLVAPEISPPQTCANTLVSSPSTSRGKMASSSFEIKNDKEVIVHRVLVEDSDDEDSKEICDVAVVSDISSDVHRQAVADDSKQTIIVENFNNLVAQTNDVKAICDAVQLAELCNSPSSAVDNANHEAILKQVDAGPSRHAVQSDVKEELSSAAYVVDRFEVIEYPDSQNLVTKIEAKTVSSEQSSNKLITSDTSNSASGQEYGHSSYTPYTNNEHDNFFYGASHFSRSFVPQKWHPNASNEQLDGEGSSYLDLDAYKGNRVDRAPSTDSLNIRTDEKMPAKGEISGQESNGDGSWSQHDTLPRYSSSYDTNVARESWSLSTSHATTLEQSASILPQFPHIDPVQSDIKPFANLDAFAKAPTVTPKKVVKQFSCPQCIKTFVTMRGKRAHILSKHENRSNSTQVSNSENASSSSTARILSANSSGIPQTKTLDTMSTPSSSSGITSGSGIFTIRNITQVPVRMSKYLFEVNLNMLRSRRIPKVEDGCPVPVAEESKFIKTEGFSCLSCSECFLTVRAYNKHMELHPAECYKCTKTFKSWSSLALHLKRHLNIKEYSCHQCEKKFVLRQNLMEHMYIHTGETPIKCPSCPKKFRRYSNMVQHRQRQHFQKKNKQPAKDYICQCGEVFHTISKYMWHKEIHEKKPKCCRYCRERFVHLNSLRRHVMLSHPNEYLLGSKIDLVPCPICEKRVLQTRLKFHLRTHTLRKMFECDICKKKFSTKWNLKQHNWTHKNRSSKPFKCTLCTKAFVRESNYLAHLNTHNARRPYTCNHCGYQFVLKYNWLRHTREHENAKQFKCNMCEKEFHRAYYLTEHMRTHTGDRPHVCTICGKRSTTKTNHNKHLKIHHARDPVTVES